MGKKVLVIGASGNVGQAIVQELLAASHQVTVASRHCQDSNKLPSINLDATNESSVAQAMVGFDAVIASVSGRVSGHETVPVMAKVILNAAAKADVKQLLWVGGAASLLINQTTRLYDSPQFQDEWKPEAKAQLLALDVFKTSKNSTVNWTFFSPAALFIEGEKLGNYQIKATDNLPTNVAGESKISFSDFAQALVTELTEQKFAQQRVAIAYK